MATYQLDYAATGEWLRSDSNLKDALHSEAERIATRARALAPVDDGDYVAGIRVSPSRSWDGRLAADVEATAPHSAAVEFGNAHTHGRGQHVLRRAAESS